MARTRPHTSLVDSHRISSRFSFPRAIFVSTSSNLPRHSSNVLAREMQYLQFPPLGRKWQKYKTQHNHILLGDYYSLILDLFTFTLSSHNRGPLYLIESLLLLRGLTLFTLCTGHIFTRLTSKEAVAGSKLIARYSILFLPNKSSVMLAETSVDSSLCSGPLSNKRGSQMSESRLRRIGVLSMTLFADSSLQPVAL